MCSRNLPGSKVTSISLSRGSSRTNCTSFSKAASSPASSIHPVSPRVTGVVARFTVSRHRYRSMCACSGKLCLGMLHHGLTRYQLQKGPDGVLGVRDPVPQDAYGFGQSLGACIPDVGVPDFRTITDAAERLVSDRDILLRLDQPGHDAQHGGRECDAAHPRLFHSLTPSKSPNGWLARNASVSVRVASTATPQLSASWSDVRSRLPCLKALNHRPLEPCRR